MKRLEHPHLEIDGVCGPPGTLRAHFHVSCHDGLTFQCPMLLRGGPCDHTWTIAWGEIDAINEQVLAAYGPTEAIHLPPCPACGATTIFNHNDVEYGLELPEHHTMRVIREHIASRPAFTELVAHTASQVDGSHQGRDFSHLPKHERPCHHHPVDLAAELAAARNPAE